MDADSGSFSGIMIGRTRVGDGNPDVDVGSDMMVVVDVVVVVAVDADADGDGVVDESDEDVSVEVEAPETGLDPVHASARTKLLLRSFWLNAA